jgi:hypothetical protein
MNDSKEINNHTSPNLVFDKQGEMLSIQLPLSVSKTEQKTILSYLWKLKMIEHLSLTPIQRY